MKKIELVNKTTGVILSKDDCKSLHLPAAQVETTFVDVSVTDISEQVNNHIHFETKDLGADLLKTFCVMDFNRKIISDLLALNPETEAFRIFIGSENSDHVQNDFSLIVLPLDTDGLEVVEDKTCIIACQKPPGCRTGKSGIIDPITLATMFP